MHSDGRCPSLTTQSEFNKQPFSDDKRDSQDILDLSVHSRNIVHHVNGMTFGKRLAERTIRQIFIPQYTRVPHRSLVAVTGKDATQFLNGILSNTIPATGGVYSSFLHAQGKVLYDVFIYPFEGESPGYLVEYDPRQSEAPPLTSMLKRYVLRSKVKVREVGSEWTVWAAWGGRHRDLGSDRCWHWAPSQAIDSNRKSTRSIWDAGTPHQILDRRVDGMGIREIVRQGDRPSFSADFDQVGEADYFLHRVRHGVPEGTEEIIPMQAFPMESNLDLMGAIDFRKGCYTGQELTVRTYHTGLIRKRVMAVQIFPSNQSPSAEFEPTPASPNLSGLLIQPLQLEEKERTLRLRGTGKLLASFRGLGLALLRADQVEALDSGQVELQVEMPVGEGEEKSARWSVRHWWPEAWPIRPDKGSNVTTM